MLTACSGSGKLMLGEVMPVDGSGGATGATGTGGSGWIVTDASPLPEDAACTAIDLVPVSPALYLVVDRSNDMDSTFQNQPPQQQNTRWIDLLDALSGPTGYLASDSARLWSTGLGYYPNPCSFHPPVGGCTNGGMQACSASSYAAPNAPNVTIGSADRVAAYLNATIDPNGPTALRVAISGVLQQIIPDWESMHPTQFAVPVVIAAAPPLNMDCNSQMNSVGDVVDVVDNTQQPRGGNSHTRTFVIGFETDPGNQGQFNRIADAGGTNEAYIISDNVPPVAQQLAEHLDDIRQRSCMFQLPPNALGGFNLRRPGMGSTQPDSVGVLQRGRSQCGQDPDHLYQVYRDPDDPNLVIGCDKLCQDYAQSIPTGGSVQFLPLECLVVRPPMR